MRRTIHIKGQLDLIEESIALLPERGSILDIGTGSGLAAREFFSAGWNVSATGFEMDAYFEDGAGLPEGVRVFEDVNIEDMPAFADATFDAVWCAHVIEHVSNTGKALAEIRRILKPGGWLFIAVPPFKYRIVGGHVNSGWSVGQLMYVLADAGFGLHDGRFIKHGYNVFGMVQRGPGPLPTSALHRANGDIETLCSAGRFPVGLELEQGFDGRIPAVNWTWTREPSEDLVTVVATALPEMIDLPEENE